MRTLSKILIGALLVLTLAGCGDIALKAIIAQKVASANGPKVLVILWDTVLGAARDRMLSTLAAYADIKSVDYVNGGTSTPTVAQLNAYDVVFMASDQYALDPATLCENVALYLDGGGKVVLAVFDWQFFAGAEIEGRLLIQYSPFQRPAGFSFYDGTLGSYDSSHPLMAGVSSFNRGIYADDVYLSVGATWIAEYGDLVPLAAEKGNVIALNAAMHAPDPEAAGGWTGDGWTLLHNAITYLASK